MLGEFLHNRIGGPQMEGVAEEKVGPDPRNLSGIGLVEGGVFVGQRFSNFTCQTHLQHV